MKHAISACIQERHAISPTIYVGATGTFFGDESLYTTKQFPAPQAIGTIVRIKEGPNYAVIAVKQANGEVKLLKR